MKCPHRIAPFIVFLAIAMAAGGQNPQGPSSTLADTLFRAAKVASPVPLADAPFTLSQVRLLAGPFKQAMDRDLKYMLSLDNDRLLHSFRLTAGLPSSAKPYGGWEKPDGELRGHTMGHYLSACAFMYASTGDARIKARADGLVAELAKCQRALGPRGYLSAFPEEFFDRVEATRAGLGPLLHDPQDHGRPRRLVRERRQRPVPGDRRKDGRLGQARARTSPIPATWSASSTTRSRAACARC